jgi:hypothetical protein
MSHWTELDVALRRWGANPSRWGPRIKVAIAAGAAAALAIYMALYQWRVIETVWDPVFGRQTLEVLDSDVSETLRHWMRIPDAALGAFCYLADVLLALAGCTRRWQFRPWIVMLFGVFAIPVSIVGAVLVLLQGTVVGAYCFPCLLTAALSLVIVYYAYPEVVSSMELLIRVARRTGSPGAVLRTLVGIPSAGARDVARIMIGHESAPTLNP